MFGVVVAVFVVTRLVGDPVDIMLPLQATPEQRAEFAHQLGLDQPIAVQFIDYVRGLAQFDLGESLWQRRPAIEIVFERLPLTLALVLPGIALALLVSLPLGIAASLHRGGWLDRFSVSSSLVGLAMPEFWVGLLLIIVFAVKLKWLPSSGVGDFRYLILPVITMALPSTARLTMIVRTSVTEELNKPYMETARAKNLGFYRLVGVHALRNAGIPILTLSGWELIRALAGYTTVVETVFAWPGLGFTTIQAIQRQDLVLLQAIVLVIAIMITAINILIDILYKFIDPRVKLT